jgi:DNA-binding transcriptional regulator YiaG
MKEGNFNHVEAKPMSTASFKMPAERFQFRPDAKEQNGCLATRRSSADSEELDDQALLEDLRSFVEESELSIPRLAELMGVTGAILSMWIAGTAKPQPIKLLEVKGLLPRHRANAPPRRSAMGGGDALGAEVR